MPNRFSYSLDLFKIVKYVIRKSTKHIMEVVQLIIIIITVRFRGTLDQTQMSELKTNLTVFFLSYYWRRISIIIKI